MFETFGYKNPDFQRELLAFDGMMQALPLAATPEAQLELYLNAAEIVINHPKILEFAEDGKYLADTLPKGSPLGKTALRFFENREAFHVLYEDLVPTTP